MNVGDILDELHLSEEEKRDLIEMVAISFRKQIEHDLLISFALSERKHIDFLSILT